MAEIAINSPINGLPPPPEPSKEAPIAICFTSLIPISLLKIYSSIPLFLTIR